MTRGFVALAILLCFAGSAGSARANGRFPASDAILFAPNDPDVIVLRVTFGLIVSRDRGRTWDWVCEAALGVVGVEDPMYAITPDGTFVASTFQGLTVSRGGACSFERALGALKDLVFIDVAGRPDDRANVLALASSYRGQTETGDVSFKTALFETTDQGQTFVALGGALDPSLRGETVDYTATDPDRIYLSATRAAAGALLTSRDHGKTWEESSLALLPEERAVYIAGVDPKMADRVYLRTFAANDKPSRLIVTEDAGKTFRTIFTGRGALAGFALAPDGSKIWVGSTKDGVHMASTTDFAFRQRSNVEVQCLAMSPDGLWACSNEKNGFVAALSTDDGATFDKRLRFCEIRGPLACAPGTSTPAACGSPQWARQRALLACDEASASMSASASAPDGGSAPAPAPSETASESGGSCSIRKPSVSPLAAIGAVITAAMMLLRRRAQR